MIAFYKDGEINSAVPINYLGLFLIEISVKPALRNTLIDSPRVYNEVCVLA